MAQASDLASALAKVERGILRVRSLGDIAETMRVLCRLYDQSNILVLAKNNNDVNELHRLCDPRDGYTREYILRCEGPRRHIAVVDKIRNSHPLEWDVILLDAEAGIAPSCRDALQRFANLVRVYGWFEGKARIRHRQMLMMTHAIGPVFYPPNAVQKPVSVYWAIPPAIATAARLKGLERKRQYIWMNEQRNGHIARMALAISQCDQGELCDLGLTHFCDSLAASGKQSLSVLVIGESPEHTREIASRLSDWPRYDLIDPNPPIGWTMYPNDRGVLPYTNSGGWIMTSMAARRLKRLDADVVLDCGSGMDPTILPFQTKSGDHRILIEYADDFDKIAVANSRDRIRKYQDNGWHNIGVPAHLRKL